MILKLFDVHTSVVISSKAREGRGNGIVESGHNTRSKVVELNRGVIIRQTHYIN